MEEKLKDKLANAVKERLSQTNRERQLQQERKKKAAMFLNLIKSSQTTEPSPPRPLEDSSALYVGEISLSLIMQPYVDFDHISKVFFFGHGNFSS